MSDYHLFAPLRRQEHEAEIAEAREQRINDTLVALKTYATHADTRREVWLALLSSGVPCLNPSHEALLNDLRAIDAELVLDARPASANLLETALDFAIVLGVWRELKAMTPGATQAAAFYSLFDSGQPAKNSAHEDLIEHLADMDPDAYAQIDATVVRDRRRAAAAIVAVAFENALLAEATRIVDGGEL